MDTGTSSELIRLCLEKNVSIAIEDYHVPDKQTRQMRQLRSVGCTVVMRVWILTSIKPFFFLLVLLFVNGKGSMLLARKGWYSRVESYMSNNWEREMRKER